MDRIQAVWMLLQVVEMTVKHSARFANITSWALKELDEHAAALASGETTQPASQDEEAA